MTHEEFFDLFMLRKYRVGCFTEQEHDAFINDFLVTTGLDLDDAGHWAGFDTFYPYLCWSKNGDHICGTRSAYPHGDPISYADYLRLIEPEVEPNFVSLEEAL